MQQNEHIFIRIETKQAVKLDDFTNGLKAIEAQYADFIKAQYEKVNEEETHLYIQELGKGSLIAELVPFVPPILQAANGVNTVVTFMTHLKKIMDPFLDRKTSTAVTKDASDKDLENVLKTVQTIAKDAKGNITISARHANKELQTATEIVFTSEQATQTASVIEAEQKERSKKKQEQFSNQLMIFNQTTLNDPKADKKSGDKAMIPTISPLSASVSYMSELAASRIKSEIKKDRRNPYLKGFLVDGYVIRVKG